MLSFGLFMKQFQKTFLYILKLGWLDWLTDGIMDHIMMMSVIWKSFQKNL